MSELPFEFDVDICPPPQPTVALDEGTAEQLRKLADVLYETNKMAIHAVSPLEMLKLSPHYSAMALINSSGVFYNTRPHSDPENLVYTVAHEVGHAIDFSRNRLAKIMLELSFRAWGADYSRWPRPNRQSVYNTEARAWDNADELVDRLGLKIDPVRQALERMLALLTYQNILDLWTEVRFDIKLEY